MPQTLILTFIADDRPGLVETLSEVVTAEGGNWLESRMAHLAEKFAGIARVEVPDDRAPSLKASLEALEAGGMRLTVEEARAAAPAGGRLLALDLVGPDHPGIVHEITHVLAGRGSSVEEMETDVREAPMGGGTLFYAKIRVRSPAGLDEDDLRKDLERLSAALMIDITLSDEIPGA